MNTTASTVGAYLRDLPPDRRVAMARLCSMIRRSARGVRESMRYGLAFYELDGPLFALESGRRHMSLYVAEKDVVLKHKDSLQGVNAAKSFIKFSDLNRLPLDVVEKIVRDSVAARRQRLAQGTIPQVIAQSHLRSDLLPSFWSAAGIIVSATTFLTVPIDERLIPEMVPSAACWRRSSRPVFPFNDRPRL